MLRDGWGFHILDGSFSFWYDNWTNNGPICNWVAFVHISGSALLVTDARNGVNWDLGMLASRLSLVNSYNKWRVEQSVSR